MSIVNNKEDLFSVFRKSLIFASLISAVFFIIKSFTEPVFTGATIGNNIIDPYILVAVSLFLFAMCLTHFFED